MFLFIYEPVVSGSLTQSILVFIDMDSTDHLIQFNILLLHSQGAAY